MWTPAPLSPLSSRLACPCAYTKGRFGFAFPLFKLGAKGEVQSTKRMMKSKGGFSLPKVGFKIGATIVVLR